MLSTQVKSIQRVYVTVVCELENYKKKHVTRTLSSFISDCNLGHAIMLCLNRTHSQFIPCSCVDMTHRVGGQFA
jgi:hypothetical protein